MYIVQSLYIQDVQVQLTPFVIFTGFVRFSYSWKKLKRKNIKRGLNFAHRTTLVSSLRYSFQAFQVLMVANWSERHSYSEVAL